jgi:acyl-CoA thioester hydrolase
MEVARVAYCRHAGFEYRDMEREGGAQLAVTEARCQYRAPARFDDEVDLVCWVTESRSRSVRFAYEMLRGGELLATGETLHTVIDSRGKMIRMPEQYRRYFPLTR